MGKVLKSFTMADAAVRSVVGGTHYQQNFHLAQQNFYLALLGCYQGNSHLYKGLFWRWKGTSDLP
jgi:hypothetical protein